LGRRSLGVSEDAFDLLAKLCLRDALTVDDALRRLLAAALADK
jgi:hypothetical protein